MIDSRSRTGSRMMLLIRSRSTALRGAARPAAGTGPCPGPSSICVELGGGSSPAARACVGSHSTNRSPISALRAHDALGVLAEVLVAGVGDVEDDGGLVVVGDVERVDRADLDAGDLDVLARDHEAGVVEDRADLVSRRLAGAERETTTAAAAATRSERRGDAPHGPGGTSEGSQSTVPPSVNGAEPSAGRWMAAPGQRRWLLVCEAVEAVARRDRRQHARRPGCR